MTYFELIALINDLNKCLPDLYESLFSDRSQFNNVLPKYL